MKKHVEVHSLTEGYTHGDVVSDDGDRIKIDSPDSPYALLVINRDRISYEQDGAICQVCGRRATTHLEE